MTSSKRSRPALQPLLQVQAKDGWISAPDGPGLGVTLNEEFVRGHLVAESGG